MRGPLSRLRGLAGRRPDDTVAYFPRCRDVHTLSMAYPLDILFVDRQGYVIEVHRGVRPRTRLRNRRGWGVVERFAQAGPWFRRGERIVATVGLPVMTAESCGLGRGRNQTRKERLHEALPYV